MLFRILMWGWMPVMLALAAYQGRATATGALGWIYVSSIVQHLPRRLFAAHPQRWVAFLMGSQTLAASVLVGAFPCIGTVLLALGAWCNCAVITANGMQMPVTRRTSNTFYCLAGPETRLAFLCDRYPTKSYTFSIGDVLIILGGWTACAQMELTLLAP